MQTLLSVVASASSLAREHGEVSTPSNKKLYFDPASRSEIRRSASRLALPPVPLLLLALKRYWSNPPLVSVTAVLPPFMVTVVFVASMSV